MSKLSIFFLSCVFFSLFASAQNPNIHHSRDSLRLVLQQADGKEKLQTYNRLAITYKFETHDDLKRDTIIAIYDEMETEAIKQNDISQQAVAIRNRHNVFLDREEYDEVIKQSLAILKFMEANETWGMYYQTILDVSSAYRRLGEYENGLREVEKAYNFAKEHDHTEGMGIIMYAMAGQYISLRKFTESEKCLRESIELLQDTKVYANILPMVYHNLISSLIGQARYEEALELTKEYEIANIRYEETSKTPQPSTWGNLWIVLTGLYRQMGEPDKAMYYIDKLDSLSNGRNKMYKERGHVLYLKGQYDEAIEMLDKAIEVNPNALEEESLKLMVMIKQGNADEATDLYYRIIVRQDSITNQKYYAQFDVLRTQYEVDKHVAEKEQMRNQFIFVLVICVLLITGILIILIIYYQKQRAYRQLVRKSQQWAGVISTDEVDEVTKTEEREEFNQTEEIDITKKPDSADISIMVCIDRLMYEEKLYLKSDVTLETLSGELGIDRRQISAAINKCTKKHFSTYINEFRIKEAVRIMSNPAYDNLSIDGIALESGFNERTTFHRFFKKYIGVTPGVFRNLSRHSSNTQN
ncbi:MAG: helix-turn-helix domain-containing protein [Prevotella sp.]|nr:helix-turn-helix domain-containing protein [Prevotella sp.]